VALTVNFHSASGNLGQVFEPLLIVLTPGARCQSSPTDEMALHFIAKQAAADAGVSAYWTDKCCMFDDRSSEEFSEDVNRISDVARAASRIVVIVGKSGYDRLPPDVDTWSLLKEHGRRLWCWPEILLGPSGEDIYVYTRDELCEKPQRISRLEFVEWIWEDAEVARQVLDHHEGTLTLSRLELVILALDSLKSRVHNTDLFLPGDLSYALMGLLRQRPKFPAKDKKDTAFQAFARLSLANDSDRLLERLCCILPNHSPWDLDQRHYWTNMDDYWGAKLWDIEPHCQVSAIAEHDTVVLDGVRGGTIHWDSFQRIVITTKLTFTRRLARFLLRLTPIWLIINSVLLWVGSLQSNTMYDTGYYGIDGYHSVTTSTSTSPLTIAGAFLMLFVAPLFLSSPLLLLHLYGGKVWDAQPWLFGFEGRLSIRDVERRIFGFYSGRFSWAPYSSTTSIHDLNTERLPEECEGKAPPVLNANEEVNDGMRTFTLVDTFTM